MYVLFTHNLELREILNNHLDGYAYDLAKYFLDKGLGNLLHRYIVNYYDGYTPTIDDIIACLEDSNIDDVFDFAFEGRIRRWKRKL